MDPTMRPPGGSAVPQPPPAYGAAYRAPASLPLGDILSQTFEVYRASFLAFAIIIAVVSIPGIFAAVVLADKPAGSFVPGLFGFFSGPVGTGAITYGVYEHLSGRPTTLSDCLRIGFTRTFKVIGVALLMGAILLAAFVACVVPVFIAFTVLAVAIPAAVQEGVSGTAALRRSASLTEGYRWTIFAALSVIALISGLVSVPVGVVLVFSGHNNYTPLGSQIVQIFIGGLSAAAPAVIYYRLRSIKESIDVRDIASVFD